MGPGDFESTSIKPWDSETKKGLSINVESGKEVTVTSEPRLGLFCFWFFF